jgi:hypothetical protein
MKRNLILAAALAAAVALSGPALAKSGHHGGGSSGAPKGETSAKPPKPTIHPSQNVKHAIDCAFHCGSIENHGGDIGD